MTAIGLLDTNDDGIWLFLLGGGDQSASVSGPALVCTCHVEIVLSPTLICKLFVSLNAADDCR